MARVIWAPQAYADLEAIGDFVSREAPRFAQMHADGIVASVDRLELFPRSGRMVPEIGDKAIREILYRGYRIMHVVSRYAASSRSTPASILASSEKRGDLTPLKQPPEASPQLAKAGRWRGRLR